MATTTKRKKKKAETRATNGLPWLRKSHGYYYVTDPASGKKTPIRDKNGEFVRWDDRLTPGENQDRANAVWYEIRKLGRLDAAGEDEEVRTVLALYLERHVEKTAGPKTLTDYQGWFRSFLGRWPGLRVRDLNADHVERWWAECHPEWGSSMRNLVGSAFKAAFNWAASRARGRPLIPYSPVQGWKLPTMRKRAARVVVTKEEFDTVLAGVTSPRVRDVLEVLWGTGTRPVNLERATRAHVAPGGSALVYDEHNTPPGATVHKTFKRTGQALAVSLSDRARDIVLRLAEEHPTGPLFLTPRGLPWTPNRLANTIRNYAKKVGLGGRFVGYSARHSLATELLSDGLTSTQVGGVLGNTGKMVERHYSHLTAQSEGVRAVLNARRGGGRPAGEVRGT